MPNRFFLLKFKYFFDSKDTFLIKNYYVSKYIGQIHQKKIISKPIKVRIFIKIISLNDHLNFYTKNLH